LLSPKLLFYLFAVFMILLRPMITYEMTMRGKINEPESVNNLFQRLIKKKDSHTEDFIETTNIDQVTAEVILPLLFVIFLRRKASWLFSLLSGGLFACLALRRGLCPLVVRQAHREHFFLHE
jgi:hypothetical protein